MNTYDVVVTLGFTIDGMSESDVKEQVLKLYTVLGGSPVVDIDVSIAD
jgi:hypothetical protein